MRSETVSLSEPFPTARYVSVEVGGYEVPLSTLAAFFAGVLLTAAVVR